MNASPECWRLYGEVEGFEMAHPSLVGRFHQLAVDAYGAQHAGGDTAYIRVAYSLVGLYLAIDRGMTRIQIREVHREMGRPDPSWPPFPRPDATGVVTIVDVADAGFRAASVDGHADAVQRWAGDVWAAWGERREAVAGLAARLLPDLP
jgi:hypothetical protein